MMTRSRITAAVLFLTALAVCLELSAGIVVLKNGYTVNGRVVRENNDSVTLGFQHGILVLAKKHVEKVITVRDLSERGMKLLPPTDEELSVLEKAILGEPQPAPPGALRSGMTDRFRTVQHTLSADGWEFSFRLPADWVKSEGSGSLVLSAPGERPGLAVCASVVGTPPVEPGKQTELTQAAAGTQLAAYSPIYFVTREYPDSKHSECTISGTCRSQNREVSVRTILRITPSHTLILTFFTPLPLQKHYEAVAETCRDSINLKETRK